MKRIIIQSLIALIGMAILSACGGDPAPANHAPTATAQSITTAEDTAKAITLAGTDEDNDTLTYTVASSPTHGTLSGTAPNLTYTPTANFNGSDSFTFTVNDGTVDSNVTTVSITVSAVNDAPTASSFSLTLDVDKSTATGDWHALSSAIDAVEGDTLTASVATQGHYGTFAIVGDGITYFKTAETNVTDSGVLSISDGHDSVSVTVTVNALYWKQLSSKKDFTIALKSDGTVWGWGSNRYGQLGDGTTTDRDHPVQESTHATDWIQVTAGYTHTAAVKSNGTLWSWGENNSGQLGNNTSDDAHSPVQESSRSTYWIKATAGDGFTVAKTSDETLYAWGDNFWGQLGIDAIGNQDEPTPVDGGSGGWSDIATGWAHVVALKSNGEIWSWGYNAYGRLGDGSTETRRAPVQEATHATDWKSIACGNSWSFAIKNDNTLYAWGENTYGQLGAGSYGGNHYQPASIGSSHWLSVRGGYEHSLGIQTDGSLWSWGRNAKAQLGNTTLSSKNEPLRIGTDNDWLAITASTSTSIALKNNYTLYGWGYNTFGQLGNKKTDTQYTPLHILGTHTWKQISVGEWHVLAIRDDRTLWAWGENGNGQLGSGTLASSYVFELVQEATHVSTWKAVAAGRNFSIGLQTDGSLWTWGANTSGQLGLGDNDYRSTPTHVGTDNWSHICAGASHTAAIRTNGYLYAWGGNGGGQLGIGNYDATNTPTREAGHLVWKEVTCGNSHTAGIHATAKTLWAWGSNSRGQLGIGNNDAKNVPTQVTGSWLSVSAGRYHTLAIKSDETLWAWGENSSGQLGNGSFTDATSPTQIGTDTDWGIIAAGGDTSMAIHMEAGGGDTVWVWGDNAGGQFGVEGRGAENSNQPQEIVSLRGTIATTNVSMSVSPYSIGLVKNDGSMWAWGTNDYKRLARDWYTKTPDKLIERTP